MEIVVTAPTSFDHLIEQIDELADPAFIMEVAEEMAAEIDHLIQKGFDSATDPYGRVWAPRKLAYGRRTPPHPPLDESGLMRSSFHVEPSQQGVSVSNPVYYSPFNNYGTRYIDGRAMLPGEGELGDWEGPLTSAAQRVFNRHLNRGS